MKVTTSGRTIELAEFPLDEFLRERFDPRPDEHITIVGPTGSGKTTVGLQVLATVTRLHPFITGLVLVMKPHKGPKSAGKGASGDRTVSKWTKKLGGKIVRSWPPPPPMWWQKRPAFYVLWPPTVGDPYKDVNSLHKVMRGALLHGYQKGDTAVFADEAAGLVAELKLEPEVKQTAQRGRSRNNTGILASQRPRYVPREMFSEASHFFLARMADESEYERLREISGGRLNRAEIVAVLSKLKRHQWLYMYPPEGIACVLV